MLTYGAEIPLRGGRTVQRSTDVESPKE